MDEVSFGKVKTDMTMSSARRALARMLAGGDFTNFDFEGEVGASWAIGVEGFDIFEADCDDDAVPFVEVDFVEDFFFEEADELAREGEREEERDF